MDELAVEQLGPAIRLSPLSFPAEASFVDDDRRLLLDPYVSVSTGSAASGRSFEIAGPRRLIFFDPDRVTAAIVTCGGLSPGLNDVIRALYLHLVERYGVTRVLGARHGYQGLGRDEFVRLEASTVADIHETGGTILGSSRGSPPVSELVERLEARRISILFTVGGDGTMRGAAEIAREIAARGLRIAVIGLPKTIDNDIPWVRRSFGFETAVGLATRAVQAAHTEAKSLRDGIGLVKLMGRHAGYIAATATLASGHVDFCLVPEVPFELGGDGGLLALLEQRLDRRGHAVIVVAEGAGQEVFGPDLGTDQSGNRTLGDIGLWLRERLREQFEAAGRPVAVKYIDPSYLIRAAPADPSDSLFCARLAQNAVHAAMAGKTAMLVGYWHGRMTHVPFESLAGRTKTINPQGELWRNVLETTGQPLVIGGGGG